MITPPYVTAWTSEEGYVVRESPLVRGPALFARRGRRGQGSPIWGKISEERQRECAAGRRCQVCHRPFRLYREPGYSLVPLRQIEGFPATHEPLCCRVCLPVTLRGCPALRRMVAAGGLTAIAVTEYQLAAQLLGPVVPPPDEAARHINAAIAEAGHRPAVGFLQLLLVKGTPMTAGQVFELAGVPLP
jgi:hypothetical protein